MSLYSLAVKCILVADPNTIPIRSQIEKSKKNKKQVKQEVAMGLDNEMLKMLQGILPSLILVDLYH
jgi:hypothetical protein